MGWGAIPAFFYAPKYASFMTNFYFAAPQSNNKNNKEQHRTTFLSLLSYVVPCCPMLFDIFSFTYNFHELPINFCAHQFMVNYMVIICSVIVVQLFFA